MLEIPKAHIPKRTTSNGRRVTVTKVEKSCEMTARLKPKQFLQNGKSAGKPERETSTTILARGVGSSEPKWWAPMKIG